jgi:hypothetical protein
VGHGQLVLASVAAACYVDFVKRSKSVEKRSRQANYQARKRSAGLCPCCGSERLDVNRRTGKPYSFGPCCRSVFNKLQSAKMKRRRAAGLA